MVVCQDPDKVPRFPTNDLWGFDYWAVTLRVLQVLLIVSTAKELGNYVIERNVSLQDQVKSFIAKLSLGDEFCSRWKVFCRETPSNHTPGYLARERHREELMRRPISYANLRGIKETHPHYWRTLYSQYGISCELGELRE